MSRLYPGWGSGKASLEETFSVYSLESLGKADMEGGDKVILPQSTFRKVSRMKLPFPLTFEVTNPRLSKGGPTGGPKGGGSRKVIPREGNDKADEGKKKPRRPLVKQFCGVYEFSAPEDKAFVPNWMMRNLRLKQGQKIHFRSVLDGKIPRGTSCRLQPHTTAFLDLAASMDLRELLEHSFRNYSVLSTGQTLVVNFAGDNYRIDVVETKPEGAISLYGNLDLEVDFAPPLDQPDVGKLRPGSREMQEGEQAAQLSFGIAEISAADPAALPAGLANVVTTNQVTSPSQRQGKVESQAGQGQTSQKPQAHDWGKGQSLNGQVVVNSPTKATQQSSAPGVIQTENLTEGSAGPTIAQPTAAVTASGAESQQQALVPRARRRNPSKFASRTAGSSFTGDGASLAGAADGTTPETDQERPSTPSFVGFSGNGRSLAVVSPTKASSGAKASGESIREKRLRFLQNLQGQQRQSPEHEDGSENGASAGSQQPRVAVGSSLNAIRKQAKANAQAAKQ